MWCKISADNFEIVRVILVFTLCLFKTECRRVKRVVGGMEVECGTQPRVTSLRSKSTLRHLCGATIVAADFALTAAHCVDHTADHYVLLLNNYCTDGSTPTAEVVEIITHELYHRRSRAHDIALLRIRLNVDDITWLRDEVLPNSSFGLSGECTIYGYGSREPNSEATSEELLAADVMIVSLDDCTEALGPIAPEYDSGMMCAVGAGADACQGDSGSPLVCDSYIEGVVSYGLSCGVRGVPGVYTSIGAHLRWIRNIIDMYENVLK